MLKIRKVVANLQLQFKSDLGSSNGLIGQLMMGPSEGSSNRGRVKQRAKEVVQ